MASRRFSRAKWRRTTTRTRGRRGPKVEVAHYANAFSLTAVAGTNTFFVPAYNVSAVISLASMVTDFDIAAQRTRSIPGEMKGVSVKGGMLCSHIVPTLLPSSGFCETGSEQQWGGGWCQITEWLYQDAFTYDAATRNEVPLILDTPWQSELVAGGVHNESYQPKRILYRNHHVLRAAVATYQDPISEYWLPDEGGLRSVGSRFKIRRAWIDERSAIWYRVTLTNPWTTHESGLRNITIGVTVSGPICYRITTA